MVEHSESEVKSAGGDALDSAAMRIAFVVQRYGVEVNGGAELHCRQLAERVAARDDVQQVKVLTTCARDHSTWANHYAPGTSTLEGIEVERFRVLTERRPVLQSLFGPLTRHGPLRRAFEPPWFLAQGPLAPGLLAGLRQQRRDFDVFVFFTYLYFPTVFGLPIVAERSLFVPTAHDEPALRLELALRAFRRTRAIAFNTQEERELVASRIDLDRVRSEIVGCGVELDPPTVSPERRERPYLLYLGRVESAKGVPELLAGFRAFRREHADRWFETSMGRRQGREVELVLAGRIGDLQPDGDPAIHWPGFVSDQRRSALLAGCEAVVIPGKLDSLSLSLLEAWALGVPTVSSADCPVKRGHTQRSGAGLLFGPELSFSDALEALLADPEARARSVDAGVAYVRAQYSWPVVTERFMRLARVVATG